MDAKKRQRCLGALARRKHDVEHWEHLADSMKIEGDQKNSFLKKRDKALEEVRILQSKLGTV